jgi:predicted GTPase
MSTIIISMPMKRYIEAVFAAKSRRERWKAKKQFRIERRAEPTYRGSSLLEYIINAENVVPYPLTKDAMDDIMNNIEWS